MGLWLRFLNTAASKVLLIDLLTPREIFNLRLLDSSTKAVIERHYAFRSFCTLFSDSHIYVKRACNFGTPPTLKYVEDHPQQFFSWVSKDGSVIARVLRQHIPLNGTLEDVIRFKNQIVRNSSYKLSEPIRVVLNPGMFANYEAIQDELNRTPKKKRKIEIPKV